MSRQLLIDIGVFETRIACLKGGILSDISINPLGHSSLVGEVFMARVSAFAGGLDAAFLDLGNKKDGFLLSAHTPKGKATDANAALSDKLHEGEKILVQVIKDKKDDKSLQLSAFIQLESQNLVFKPMADGVTYSRQIKDAPFKQTATQALLTALGSQSGGITVRSSGINQSPSQLQNELQTLLDQWQDIQQRATEDQKPRSLRAPEPPELRAIKKFSTKETRIRINDRRQFSILSNLGSTVIGDLELWAGPDLLFDAFEVEAQLEEAQEIRTSLPSGGNITMEQTEALVVIDVNSGSLTANIGKKSVAAITNTEAAAQICQQIRLRNLSGIIIIDFIHDQDKGAIKTLTNLLQSLALDDPSSVRIIGMTELGLMQLTRQRIEAPLSEILRTMLPGVCAHIPAQHAAALLRQLAHYGRDHKTAIIPLRVAKSLSPLLHHYKAQMEAHIGVHIDWKEDASLTGLHYTLGTSIRDK